MKIFTIQYATNVEFIQTINYINYKLRNPDKTAGS